MPVDDRYPARVLVVGLVEAPSAENLNAHGLEVLEADDILTGHESVISVRRLVLGLQFGARPDVTHWKRKREARVLNAWDRLYSPLYLVKENSSLSLRVPDLSDVHVNIEDAFRSKAQ